MKWQILNAGHFYRMIITSTFSFKMLGLYFCLVFVFSNGLASFFCHPKCLQDSEKQISNDFSDKLTT